MTSTRTDPEVAVARDHAGGLVAISSAYAEDFGGAPPSYEALLALRSETLRDQRRTKLYRATLPRSGRPAFLKLYLFPAGFERLGTWRRRSSAAREFEGLRLFASAGVPVAEPIAFGERRRKGFIESCAILEEVVEGAADLRAWAEAIGPRARDAADVERGAVLDELARHVRALHDRGIVSGEGGLHLKNVLLRPATSPSRLVFIDVPKAHVAAGRALATGRALDLGRLLVRIASNFGDDGAKRFFDGYHDADRPASERAAIEARAERERRRFADETLLAFAKSVFRHYFRSVLGIHRGPEGRRRG